MDFPAGVGSNVGYLNRLRTRPIALRAAPGCREPGRARMLACGRAGDVADACRRRRSRPGRTSGVAEFRTPDGRRVRVQLAGLWVRSESDVAPRERPDRFRYDCALARWRRCLALSLALCRAARSLVRGCRLAVRFMRYVPCRGRWPPRLRAAIRRLPSHQRYPHGTPSKCRGDKGLDQIGLTPCLALAPRDGFEPSTQRLTAACSTTELPGIRTARRPGGTHLPWRPEAESNRCTRICSPDGAISREFPKRLFRL